MWESLLFLLLFFQRPETNNFLLHSILIGNIEIKSGLRGSIFSFCLFIAEFVELFFFVPINS